MYLRVLPADDDDAETFWKKQFLREHLLKKFQLNKSNYDALRQSVLKLTLYAMHLVLR